MGNSLKGLRRTDANDMFEAEAVRLARAGDSNAFEYLYKSHSPRVYRLCLRMTGNPTEAEDMTQEAFLQLFRKIHIFRGESRFSTWLHRVTVNVVLMSHRRKQHPELSLDAKSNPGEEDSKPLIELSGPDLRLKGLVDRLNLSKALDRLPDRYKEMFILHDVEGYQHKEIVTILGCSIGTSKSQLFRARRRLRNLLQKVQRSRAKENLSTRTGMKAVQRLGSSTDRVLKSRVSTRRETPCDYCL
jgi:RNA polymerase sigma-70 factor, ECF subfamily